MKILIQRVTSARVLVLKKVISRISDGLVVFVCFERGDNESYIEKSVKKIMNIRLWPGKEGKSNDLSVTELKYQILLISQFTLSADCMNGNRPDYTKAMPAEQAKFWYDKMCNELIIRGANVCCGIFQEQMEIELNNNGPMTFFMDII